ncbi:DUF4175 family protein [Pseudoduganella sp. FT93W]|uniref:DUF4175 family protein n=1 Tax=Duganella fentianensis TaxID=2692177 RepID=A0A845I052_9BURK|nr:DUF4175 family protein [Duganella fentianensis]MYN46512.1 DUF4175 family protein [Duganella fentianensis]
MRDETELLRLRLHRAIFLRRLPVWGALLVPLLLALWLLPAARLFVLAGLLLAALWVVFDAQRWRQRVHAEWTSWLNAAVPALEDSADLLAMDAISAIGRLQQQRLLARLHAVLGVADYAAIARSRVRWPVLPLLALVLWLMIGGVVQSRQSSASMPSLAQRSARVAGGGEAYLRVVPPAYTGSKPFETVARDVQIPQYSEVYWCLKDAGSVLPVVELGDGSVLQLGAECIRRRVDESLFWRLRQPGATRYTIRVIPDQAPEVTIAEPTELIHVLARDARSVQIAVSAKDDYAISRASLHMTLARGSGENIRFSDREVPLPQSANPKERSWKKQWNLGELGMEPGDELYFFVRASDNAPDHPHTTQSPTYTLRLPAPEAESLEATALPSLAKPETLRSQRQIIIDTEQLLADMQAQTSMPPATVRSRSEAIASDQAKLRLRYGQFLGEESSLFGDEHESEHGHEGGTPAAGFGRDSSMLKEFGHAHDQEDNATIFDPKTKAILKRALAAMWDAEKSLRAITPKTALVPEYKALEAIKELQAAERVYLHRTAFVPPALKEEKRMSGDIVGVLGYKRAQGAASVSVPAEVRELVQALAQDGALPALWSKAAREAISQRITDPEQKLAAQRAVQDVQDGCMPCRGELRAWLRGTLSEAPVLLQSRSVSDTAFRRAWNGKEPVQ